MAALVALEARLVRWARMIALAGFAGLLVVAGATMLDVVLRWLFNRPIKGLIDVTELAVVVVLAACFPVVIAQRGNITIRFLGAAAGPRVARWLDAFGSLALLAFVALVSWQLVAYTAELAASGRTTWLLRLPVTPSWAVATAIVALCVPVQAVAAAADVARALGRAPERTATADGGDTRL